ncbi:MAG: LytR C-terminal domain-containing protein [Thermodesulfobacteriota bacterium]|nr:LytR C-terminal domain-containing protein [Thermodesulfobacteriota bacterium]
MKVRWKRATGVVLSVGLFLFSLIGCSTMKDLLGQIGFWDMSSQNPEQIEKEISRFVSHIRPQPGNPDSHYLLACYYQDRDRHKEAIEEFRKVLSIDRRYVKAYNGVGVSNDMLGDFPTAITYYKMALSLDPNLDYLHNNLGYSYLLQGNIDEAILAFQRAIALNGQEDRFHNNLGVAYAEKGQYDLALVELRLAGDEAKAHHNMAQLYFKKGLYHEAKDHYAKALSLNPSLTVVGTGLDAASTLARIFEPENKKLAVKALVIPNQPVIKKEEAIKVAAALRSPEKYPDAKQTIAEIPQEGQIEAGILTQETPLIRMETTIVRIEELKQPEHPKTSESATVKSQPPARNENEVRVEEILSLKKAGIEISNGNGVNRMAWRVGNYLKEKGLSVVRLTNADHFNHNETIIYYQNGQRESVDLLTDYLPVNFDKEEIKKLDRPDIKIKVLVGKDLVPKNKMFENNNGTRKKQG